MRYFWLNFASVNCNQRNHVRSLTKASKQVAHDMYLFTRLPQKHDSLSNVQNERSIIIIKTSKTTTALKAFRRYTSFAPKAKPTSD